MAGAAPDGVSFVDVAGGRRLAWSEYGDPAGAPVVWHHGGLSCRLDAARVHPSALESGVRLIAPDRPGIGWSDRDPGRTVASWGTDVATLVDRLGIDRFATVGWSAGGPHALATAAVLGTRVTRVATCGGMAPLRDRADTKALGLAVDRLLVPLSRHWPWAARRVVSLASGRRGREKAKAQTLKVLGATDRAVLADLPAEAVVLWEDGGIATFAHGYAGTVDDYRAFGSPDWGFALSEVTAPVDCWQGADDDLVPLAHAERLAGSLPEGTLRVVPGSGHFLPSQTGPMAEVLRTLVG